MSSIKIISQVEEKLKSGEISIRGFSESPVHPKPEDAECLDALLVIDALNFSFWTSDTQPKWTVKFKGCSYTGYFAMCAALMRAVEVCKLVVKSWHIFINKLFMFSN